MTGAPLDHCLDLLRRADPDRHLACLWLRAEWRGAIAAIYAFNAEISRIASLVSEPMPGEIRLQWWREVIEGKRESGDAPVSVALLDCISRHDLPVATFANYLEARVFDLYHDPMPNRAAFEGYCGETASAMLMLAAQCAGAPGGAGLADACGHGGVAQTVAAVLRSARLHRHERRCYIPVDILSAAGLDAEGWLDTEPDDRHRAAIGNMVDWGRQHLAKSRAALARLDPELRPVFLPLAPVALYLDRAEGRGTGILSRPVELSPLTRQWLFFRSAMRGIQTA